MGLGYIFRNFKASLLSPSLSDFFPLRPINVCQQAHWLIFVIMNEVPYRFDELLDQDFDSLGNSCILSGFHLSDPYEVTIDTVEC